MNGTTYEVATWYEIESNKMHLKKDGEKYVADAMLFRDNLNLRQENESLKKENAKLREMLQRTWDAFHDATAREFVMVKNELRELGVVVDG